MRLLLTYLVSMDPANGLCWMAERKDRVSDWVTVWRTITPPRAPHPTPPPPLWGAPGIALSFIFSVLLLRSHFIPWMSSLHISEFFINFLAWYLQNSKNVFVFHSVTSFNLLILSPCLQRSLWTFGPCYFGYWLCQTIPNYTKLYPTIPNYTKLHQIQLYGAEPFVLYK